MPGRTRVYVDMVGDLFHPGHAELLRQARSFGDWLVVGILSDDVVAAYKRRPIMTLDERAAVVRACRYVDEVVLNAPDVVTTEFLAAHDTRVSRDGRIPDGEPAPSWPSTVDLGAAAEHAAANSECTCEQSSEPVSVALETL